MGFVVNATPGPCTSGKQTRYPLYRRLGGPQSRSGWVRRISLTPGFAPRTVQPVASRYTDWTISAHNTTMAFDISLESLTVRDCNKISSCILLSHVVKVLCFRDKTDTGLGFTKPPASPLIRVRSQIPETVENIHTVRRLSAGEDFIGLSFCSPAVTGFSFTSVGGGWIIEVLGACYWSTLSVLLLKYPERVVIGVLWACCYLSTLSML
jgi:hypothetical protein